LEKTEIQKVYELLERNVLILIAIPIPFFAIAYLHSQNGTLSWELPEIPAFWETSLLITVYFLLAWHYLRFHASIKNAATGGFALNDKVRIYAAATMQRFWILFLVGIICALGLIFFDNPGYTLAFAISLVFSSLGKPTPDRIIRLLRLKGEEKDEIEQLKKRMF
jgi:hypothetical protein